jgi:hypothetical protein
MIALELKVVLAVVKLRSPRARSIEVCRIVKRSDIRVGL